MFASSATPGGSVPELIDQVFASGTDAVICNEYGAPIVPGVVDSGPIVSLATPGLMLMMKRSSEGFLNGQVVSLSYLTVR